MRKMENTPMGALLAQGTAAAMTILVALFDTPKELLDVFKSNNSSLHVPVSEISFAVPETNAGKICGELSDDRARIAHSECLFVEVFERYDTLSDFGAEPKNLEHVLSIAAHGCRDVWRQNEQRYMESPVCLALTQLLASNY
jgi:hypothetical protein